MNALRFMAGWHPLLRVITFIVGVVLVWLPVALPLYGLSGQGILPGGDLVPTVLLYLIFLVLLPRWQQHIHGVKTPWRDVGLTGYSNLFAPLLKGGLLGLSSIAILGGIQIMLGWAQVYPVERHWPGIILLGGITAFAVGWAEELLFRGWLLRELERGWSASAALVTTSVVFALAHFIKPLEVILTTLPQFFGLLLLGLVLGWARHIRILQKDGTTTSSLGLPIGLHSGLVWGYYILNVGQLLKPTAAVPDWVTGINGNPLAGILGLMLLTSLAIWGYRQAHLPRKPYPER